MPIENNGAAGRRGDAPPDHHQPDGKIISAPLEEGDTEYDLYTSANAISNAYPANARPAPSAIYELLRFGRVIGPDPLNPTNVPHWRQIRHPGGTGWVNLNAPGITRFSDADFPHWKHWTPIDDSADGDSRCDSATVKGWLNTNGDGKVTPSEALTRMSIEPAAPRLARAICKFPTEWNAATFEKRLGWLKEPTPENPTPLTAESIERLRRHIQALAFWDDSIGLPEKHWHWNPKEFIRHFRLCGWLSQQEMIQCIPRNSPAGLIPLSTATSRIKSWGNAINKMARKYLLQSSIRITHLLAQVWAETGYLRLTRESGADKSSYAPYIGRGLIQITWQEKYENYIEFANLPKNFDIELIATDQHHSGNSSGFYWISKSFFEPKNTRKTNLTIITDLGLDTDTIGKLCLWINGGENHYAHRHIHTIFISKITNDSVYENQAPIEKITFNRMEFQKESTNQNNQTKRVIKGTHRSTSSLTISIDFTPQK